MRNFFAGLSGGSGAFAAAGLCVVLIVAGIYVQSGRNAEQDPAVVAAVLPQSDTAEAVASPEPAAEPQAAPATEAAAPPEEETTQVEETASVEETAQPETVSVAAAPLPGPTFDEVRREADGVTVIAGRAAPGAEVTVLQNGTEVARATADGAGKFATIALIPPDGLGHVLSLLQMRDGDTRASEDEIILAPMAPPVVAEAQPAPEAVVPTAPQATPEAAPDAEAEVTQADPVQGTAPAQIADAAEALEDAPQVAAPIAAVEGTEAPTPPTATPPDQPAAAAPVAVLRSTAAGVELLNTPSPEAMTNVEIDTISYSDLGEVELAGRAQSDTTSVRVYLDNNSVINLPVDAQGRWRGELPDVDEGIYTLRVDEVSTTGQVTSRVETPFKREAPAVLAAAAANTEGPLKAITVQEGATLWAIARDRYGDGALYVRVFEANNAAIRDPDLIYPGQVFDLPD